RAWKPPETGSKYKAEPADRETATVPASSLRRKGSCEDTTPLPLPPEPGWPGSLLQESVWPQPPKPAEPRSAADQLNTPSSGRTTPEQSPVTHGAGPSLSRITATALEGLPTV